jgi:hypothetical protein
MDLTCQDMTWGSRFWRGYEYRALVNSRFGSWTLRRTPSFIVMPV